MPPRRSFRRRTRSRRAIRGVRRTRRRMPRSSRSFTGRRTSRRRILNVTSVKKRDNMLSAVFMPGTSRPTLGAITATSGGFRSLFCPTARQLAPGVDAGMSMRQSQTTYAVGYKERLQVDVSGGGVWKWRRIVFAYKGGNALWRGTDTEDWTEPFFSKSVKSEPNDPTPLAPDMARVIAVPTNKQHLAIRDLLWDGSEGLDWASEFTAKVDTKRVRLLSDKTYSFNPGNESGTSRSYNLWYPLRKNIVYDDTEIGGNAFGVGSVTSVQSKLGLGDVYIYDIVENMVKSKDTGEAFRFSPEGTYYWHER